MPSRGYAVKITGDLSIWWAEIKLSAAVIQTEMSHFEVPALISLLFSLSIGTGWNWGAEEELVHSGVDINQMAHIKRGWRPSLMERLPQRHEQASWTYTLKCKLEIRKKKYANTAPFLSYWWGLENWCTVSLRKLLSAGQFARMPMTRLPRPLLSSRVNQSCPHGTSVYVWSFLEHDTEPHSNHIKI